MITGGLGNDTLFGGAGDDLVLSGACIDRDAGFRRQGLVATRFCKDLSQGAQNADDRVLHDRRTGNVRSDRDGAGGAGPKLIRQLDPGTRITAADIHVDRSP
jgi:hypothetical protein